MQIAVVILLSLLGLVIGSFIGALTYRLPRRISIVRGRSICPNCKKKIHAYDNIPLLSFIILRGKCRNCKKEISLRYPLIEAVTAIIFIAVGLNVVNLVFASILFAIFVIDLEHQIIPDELVNLGLAVLLFILLVTGSESLFPRLLSGFASASILLTLNLITKGKGMGLGDAKLAILIGSFFVPPFFLIWLFFSFASGAAVGVVLILARISKLKTRIAFGPFLIIGAVLTMLYGEAFLKILGI
ncbi:MAG TPA: prepilin peptidase [Candidatus Saccharimonadales bacterium]|nr:prepilin peptidase [Candidatus Saccharimonadales bacterium]